MRVVVMVGVVLAGAIGPAGAADTIARDPADLPYVAEMLHMNSHNTLTVFMEDVGTYDGTITIGNDIIHAVTLNGQMQVFCGEASIDASNHLMPRDIVFIHGKVLIGDSVFVMQSCSIDIATPHQREIHDRIYR